jgi:hypothetical protein
MKNSILKLTQIAKPSLLVVVAFCFGLFLPIHASAVNLIDLIDSRGGPFLTNFGLANAGETGSHQFQMGATPHTLTSISILMGNNNAADANVRVALHADSGSNSPGALIENLSPNPYTLPGPGPQTNEETFTALGTTTLAANTKYWVRVTFVSNGSANPAIRANSNNINSGTETLLGQIHYNGMNQGAGNASFAMLVEGTVGTPTNPEIDVTGNGNSIAGNGSNVPSATDFTDFGGSNVGTPTAENTFAINNSGTANLNISSVVVGGTHSGDFAVTTNPAASVGFPGSTNLGITFTPGAAGVRTATVTINNSDPDEGAYVFNLRGTGTLPATPEINVNDGPLVSDADIPNGGTASTFGTVAEASGDTTKTFNIDNVGGTATLTIVSVTTVGGDAADFTVGVVPVSIGAGGDATFDVTFDPSLMGNRTTTLRITSDDGDESPYDITLNGYGAPSGSFGLIDSRTAGGDFGPSFALASTGETVSTQFEIGSAAHTLDSVALLLGNCNANNGSVTISVHDDSGANSPGALLETLVPGNFILTGAAGVHNEETFNASGSTLLAANTKYWVRITNTGAGSACPQVDLTANNIHTGTETHHGQLHHNGVNQGLGGVSFKQHIQGTLGAPTPSEINVQGQGINIADGDTTPQVPDDTDFGNVNLGGDDTHTFTIENLGVGDLELVPTAVTITGTNAGDFSVTVQPDATVSPAGNTTFQVQFTPSALGLREATVEIASNDADENPYTFAIQGTGTAAASPEINVNDGLLVTDADIPNGGTASSFGSVLESSGTATKTFNIDNSAGTAVLNISGIITTGGDAADFVPGAFPATIAIGASGTFDVVFDPSATGNRTTTLEISSDDGDENPYQITLNGFGAPPGPFALVDSRTAGGDLGLDIGLSSTGQTASSQFAIGASDHTLQSVSIIMQNCNANQGSVTVSVHDDNGANAPGALLETLSPTNFLLTGAATVHNEETFTAAGTTLLSAGTKYWVRVTNTGVGSACPTMDVTANSTHTGSEINLGQLHFNGVNQGGGGSSFKMLVEGSFGAPVTGPEIDVTGQGMSIAGDGTNTPATADDTNFGSVECGVDPAVVHTFTINNTGDTLNLTGMPMVQLSGSSNFAVTQQPTTPLAALTGTTTFDITFTPTSAGAKTATVSIDNDDVDENPYTFNIAATGTDTTPPVITLTGANPLDIECNVDTYTDPGFSASDACDGSLTGSVVVAGDTVDESTPGTYNVTYNVSDAAGNPATEVTRVVTVEDTLDPVISGAKDIVVSVPAGGMSDPITYSLTATDLCDPSVVVVCVPPSGTAFPVGVNTVNCTATDDEGNVGMASFNVIVLEIAVTPGVRFLDAISLRGDPATGATGTIFSINKAFLNNNDEVIFDAALSGAGTSNSAVFVGPVNGPHTAIAVKDTASGAGNFGGFSNLTLNDDGDAGFQSQLGANAGHFVDTGAGPNPSAVRNGAVSGVPGALFSVLHKPGLATNGELLTPASLFSGPGGVTFADDTIVTSSNGTVVAREGDASGIAATAFGQLNPRITASENNSRYSISSYLTEAPFDVTTNAAVFSGILGGGAPSVVARKGDSANGTPGTFFQFLGDTINSAGEVVLRANITGGGSSSTNNECLWTNSGNIGGPPVLIAREGDDAPCLAPSDVGLVAFDRFSTIHMAEDGSVCFFAYLKDATAAPTVNSSNDGSLWRWSNGVLHLIVREGDLGNNTDGATIKDINDFSCNEVGGVVYQATFFSGIGDSTSTTNIGVYLDEGGAPGAAELVLRRGDTFDLTGTEHTVAGIRISTETNPGGGRGGFGRAIDDQGRILLNLTLSGSAGGLFVLGSEPD